MRTSTGTQLDRVLTVRDFGTLGHKPDVFIQVLGDVCEDCKSQEDGRLQGEQHLPDATGLMPT